MACSICEHEDRRQIEEYLIASDYGVNGMSLADIAEKYGVPLVDLQVHALMHTPLARLEDSEVGTSIADGLKKREASLLSMMADEYWITLKNTGKAIRTTVQNESGRLTKQMVDLYVGVGNNLRQTMESIVAMDQKINGENDAGTRALVDIVKAIRGDSGEKSDRE